MENKQNLLKECLYDKAWCIMYGIDYINPDVDKAKEILQQDQSLKTYKPKNLD